MIYTAMVGLICIFFAGNGEFIYEGFNESMGQAIPVSPRMTVMIPEHTKNFVLDPP